MPRGLRSRLAGFLLQRTPAPAFAPLAARLRAAQVGVNGCGGCGGCGSSSGGACGSGGAQAMRFHPSGSLKTPSFSALSVPEATKQ
jgi:hypothetical protein